MLDISHSAYHTGVRQWAAEHKRRTCMNRLEELDVHPSFLLK